MNYIFDNYKLTDLITLIINKKFITRAAVLNNFVFLIIKIILFNILSYRNRMLKIILNS